MAALFSVYPPFERVPELFEEGNYGCCSDVEPDYLFSFHDWTGRARIFPVENTGEVLLNYYVHGKPAMHFLISQDFDVRQFSPDDPHFDSSRPISQVQIEGSHVNYRYFFSNDWEGKIHLQVDDEKRKLMPVREFDATQGIFKQILDGYSYEGDGENFIYFGGCCDYRLDSHSPMPLEIIWGNSQQLFHEKIYLPSLARHIIASGEQHLKQGGGSIGVELRFDRSGLAADPKGFWGGLAYYHGEGGDGQGGVIFLPLDGSRVRLLQPLWMLPESIGTVTPLGNGRVILSQGNEYEGSDEHDFVNPWVLDAEAEKITRWPRLNNDFEEPVQFLVFRGRLWVLTNQALYCFTLDEKVMEPLGVFVPDWGDASIVKLNPQLVIENVRSKECNRWLWGLRWAGEMGYEQAIPALRGAWKDMDHHPCISEQERLMLEHGFAAANYPSKALDDAYRYFALKGLARAGDGPYIHDLLKGRLVTPENEGVASWPVNYLLWKTADAELNAEMCKRLTDYPLFKESGDGSDDFWRWSKLALPFYPPSGGYYHGNKQIVESLVLAIIKTEPMDSPCLKGLLKHPMLAGMAMHYMSMEKPEYLRPILAAAIESGTLNEQEIDAVGRLKIREALPLLKQIALHIEPRTWLRWEALKAWWAMDAAGIENERDKICAELGDPYLQAGFEALEEDPQYEMILDAKETMR